MANLDGFPATDRAAAGLLAQRVLFAMGLHVLALVLGIIGSYEANRKRLFAVLGMFLSGIVVLGIVCAIALILFVRF